MGLLAAGRGGKPRSPAPPAASSPKVRLGARLAGRAPRILLCLRTFLGFKTVKSTYMQCLILPVSCFLVSSPYRRKTCFEISKLRRVGNAISVTTHVPQWGLSAPGSHSVSGPVGRGQNTAGRGKFCKSLIFGRKKHIELLRDLKLFLRLGVE